MAPIPVYTDSPITATKASGVTPQTAPPSTTSRPTPTSSSPTSSSQAYPPAQPGAAPSLPTATAAVNSNIPPAPQPGAVPIPTGVPRANIPPPPKAGERLVSIPYPQQMSIPPPTAPYPSQERGTFTVPVPTSVYGDQGSTALSDPPVHHSLEHPPGYHQNSNASGLDDYQRSAIQRSEAETQTESPEGGVWEAAKKWAHQTGEKIAAAENEVWKKISKE
ncbi:uncharacterized protein F4812DRAFT_58022 [Daldinia caldariorum]|uniref:uncharacterized protein n=1 Tax=Daldinia caldariorum TaxID=326644 RepID=UPI002007E711|nr:uncharacterized protein F4812DRAFT_58022 [Daldinia caldariorum]KAI1467288.1 hypothetical protein F4812DRAFT_58022 [Daldinia caldariorum]